MTRLRIISDGTTDGTWVLDDDGNSIENVTAIHWQLTGNTVTATLTIADAEAELVIDESPKTTLISCPRCETKFEMPTKDIGRRADVIEKPIRWKCAKCGKYSLAEDWFDVSGMN